MTHYHVGDIPSEDVVIEPARTEDEPYDLTPFTDAVVEFIDPAGEPVPSIGFAGSIDHNTGQVVVEWPTESGLFTTPGLYALRVTLTGDTATERLPTVFIVVESDTGWSTLDRARSDDWVEARTISDVKLWRLLEVARMQILEKAPALTTAVPPLHYVEAQLMHAKNIWNAGRVGPSGEVGGDGFAIQPRPLDWWVLQLIRPKRAIPVIR